MHATGHLGVNALLYAPFLYSLLAIGEPKFAILAGAIFMIGAKLPDEDIRFDQGMNPSDSLLPKIIPIQHRGVTHTLWFALVVGAAIAGVLYFIPSSYPPFLLANFGFLVGFLGIIGHLLGDVVTPMGIEPFAPISRTNYSLGLFYAKNSLANALFGIIGLLLCGLAAVSGVGALPQLVGLVG